jgi:hypothetical protein
MVGPAFQESAHDKELPELRDLASGKITKAQYNKDSGVEELEENSGIKLLLSIKGTGTVHHRRHDHCVGRRL